MTDERKRIIVNCGVETRFYRGFFVGSDKYFFIFKDVAKGDIKVNKNCLAVIEDSEL